MFTRSAVQTPLRLLTSSLFLSSVRPTNICPSNMFTSYQRLLSTTASTFTLDQSIFNTALYRQVTDIWFPGVDTSGQALDMSVAKRWFMGSPEERLAFDGQCRTAFAHALEAIGPDTFPEATSQPFLEEIARVVEEEGPENGAWTALSLTLLLDQIPRNIYRTTAGLRLVYTHYDSMAYELVRALLSPSSPIPRPDIHPLFRLSSAHRVWFYLPLMHSEDLSAHSFADEIRSEYKREVEGLEGYEGTKMFLKGHQTAAREHRDILERFGRYPHRNAALGRQTTQEEKAFLEGGGATFGVGEEKKENISALE
jgi:uncharacterized protein (DUF924 family)